MSEEDVAAIAGLLDGEAPIIVAPAEGPVPLLIPIDISLNEPEISCPYAKRVCAPEQDVAAIAGLLDGAAPISVAPSEGPVPLLIPIDISLNEPEISCPYAKRVCAPEQDVPSIACLLDGVTIITPGPSEGPVPLLIPIDIGLDQPSIRFSCTVRECVAEQDVAAIAGLLDGEAPIIVAPAEGLVPLLITIGIGLNKLDISTPCKP